MSNQKNNQTLDVNDTLAKSEAFITKYKKQIITAVVAIVVIVGGSFAYVYGYAKPQEDKAQECLGIVQKYILAQDFEHALKGKTKEAIKYLEDYSTKGDATVSFQALSTLANAYAADKQLDKAVETFKKAAKSTDIPALCSQALFDAGLILESQNKKDDALKLYQDIKKDYPSAPICSRQQQGGVTLDAVIDKYIERLSK